MSNFIAKFTFLLSFAFLNLVISATNPYLESSYMYSQYETNNNINQSPNLNSTNGGIASNAGTILGGSGGVSNGGGASGGSSDSSLANIGTQNIATAFTFGLSGFAFATLPFLFILVTGIIRANNGHNAHSASVISVFITAFVVHLISCVLFMLGIKMLDVLSAIYEPNYFQNKIFSIFWARGEDAVMKLAGASGSMEDKGAYLQLFVVQSVIDWVILLMFWVVLITATSYGIINAKKEQARTNAMEIFIWCMIANIIGIFSFYLWAKIATLAMFIPNTDLVGKIIQAYTEIVQNFSNS